LARELGWYDVDAMLASSGHSTFHEWVAYAELMEEERKRKEKEKSVL
jgi:hypothetical protein